MFRSRLMVFPLVSTAAVVLLAGCFFAPPTITGGGTDGNPGTGQGDNPDPQTGDQTFAGVPASFPAEIPLVAGDVPVGLDVGTGWSVLVQVANAQESYAEASALLTGAGFEVLVENSGADGSFGAFENPNYQVQVTGSETEDYGQTISYLVVKKD